MKTKKTLIIILLILIAITIIISILFILNNSKKNNSLNETATIKYIYNNLETPLTDGIKFNSDMPITFTWDINTTATIIDQNNNSKTLQKKDSLNTPGKYKITVGLTTINFDIIEDSIERYIKFDKSAKKITINNTQDIIKLKFTNSDLSIKEIFTQEDDIPTNYSFEKPDTYTIEIETITGKIIEKDYSIKNF